MAEIEWVEKLVRDAVVVLTDGTPCQCPRCTCIRKLATAVRLAEHEAHVVEKGLDLGRVVTARGVLRKLVTRLRSGDVEAK